MDNSLIIRIDTSKQVFYEIIIYFGKLNENILKAKQEDVVWLKLAEIC